MRFILSQSTTTTHTQTHTEKTLQRFISFFLVYLWSNLWLWFHKIALFFSWKKIKNLHQSWLNLNGFLVSKETMGLCRWEIETKILVLSNELIKFTKRVYHTSWLRTSVKDLEKILSDFRKNLSRWEFNLYQLTW